jgi:hypothetical protein
MFCEMPIEICNKRSGDQRNDYRKLIEKSQMYLALSRRSNVVPDLLRQRLGSIRSIVWELGHSRGNVDESLVYGYGLQDVGVRGEDGVELETIDVKEAYHQRLCN